MLEGYTFVKKHVVVYQWQVNNISSRLQTIHFQSIQILSSEFSTGANIEDRWQLELNFNNGVAPKYSKDVLTFFLKNLNTHEMSFQTEISVLNSSEKDHLFRKKYTQKLPKRTRPFKIGWNFSKKVLLDKKLDVMLNDMLTIYVKVTVYDNKITIPVENLVDPSKGQLIEDLKDVYGNRVNSDVSIIIEGKRFEAHKFILMARSPVLAAMFTHDITEKKSNEVSIADIKPELFEKLLEYIYTDQVSNLDLVAADLLEAADKYQLHSLKKMCEVSICKNLNCDNAIEIMTLADRHNATNLAKYVSKCIAMDGENIINSNGFKEIEKSSVSFRLFKSTIAVYSNNKPEIVYSS